MPKSNYVQISPALYHAFDDALTYLRAASKAEGSRPGDATEVYIGLLAFANKIEDASRCQEPSVKHDSGVAS